MTEDRADKSRVIDNLVAKFPRGKQNVSFEEAYALLEETESALDKVGDDRDLRASIGAIRDELVQKLDVRAKELGMSEKWEQMKKYRSTLKATNKLLQTDSGKDFFDTFASLSDGERNALKALEQEGLLDLSHVRRNAPLAGALKENSTSGLFVAMLRTHPVQALGLFLRYYGWIIVAACAVILLLANLSLASLVALGLAILLFLSARRHGAAPR